MISVLLLVLAFWCWFHQGPRFLRWPVLLVIVLISSGHPLGAEIHQWMLPFLGPLLLFGIMVAGFAVMLRGFFGSRHHGSYYDTRRGRFHDRW